MGLILCYEFPSMRLACFAKAGLSVAPLRNLRILLGDFRLFRWPAPGRRRITLPRAVILTRLAIALFVFIFGITATSGRPPALQGVEKDKL